MWLGVFVVGQVLVIRGAVQKLLLAFEGWAGAGAGGSGPIEFQGVSGSSGYYCLYGFFDGLFCVVWLVREAGSEANVIAYQEYVYIPFGVACVFM